MAKPRMDLSAFIGKLLEEQDGDVLREGIRVLSQALMETEVAGLIGAERHERTGERTAYRNGSRTRTWDTRMGTIELAIPKVRPGTYFPSLLQPRRRAEHALLAVVQEAYVHGVSTRKVDDLVKALGVDGISKSEVSRICGELDTVVAAFRTRPLTGEHRYLWVDATYHKVRVDGRVQSQATVVAVGVTTEGERQVLGIDVGPSEDRAFWTAFLRSLVKRGLNGVRLVISDAHEGLKQAISTVLSGSSWQRCRVHFMRNLLATVPQGAREAIAAIVRTIFAQPDHASALTQLRKVADGLRTRFPRAATVLEEAAEDILAYRHLPLEHQRQLHSTNPLERLNKEIKRRSNVVGIFPNPAAVDPPGRRDPHRAGRRVGRGRASLFQRGVDEAADDAVAVDDDTGDPGSNRITLTAHGRRRELSGRRERGRGDADFRDDLLRGLDAEPGDLGEALDGLVMRRQEVGHLLIEVAEMRLQQSEFFQRQREEPPIHGMQRGAGVERIRRVAPASPAIADRRAPRRWPARSRHHRRPAACAAHWCRGDPTPGSRA